MPIARCNPAHEPDIRRVRSRRRSGIRGRRASKRNRVRQTHQRQLIRVAGGLDARQRAQSSRRDPRRTIQLLRRPPAARQTHLERQDIGRVVAEIDANQSARSCGSTAPRAINSTVASAISATTRAPRARSRHRGCRRSRAVPRREARPSERAAQRRREPEQQAGADRNGGGEHQRGLVDRDRVKPRKRRAGRSEIDARETRRQNPKQRGPRHRQAQCRVTPPIAESRTLSVRTDGPGAPRPAPSATPHRDLALPADGRSPAAGWRR